MDRRNRSWLYPVGVVGLAIAVGWTGSTAIAGIFFPEGNWIWVNESPYYEAMRPVGENEGGWGGSYYLYASVEGGRETLSYTARYNAYVSIFGEGSSYGSQETWVYGWLDGRSRFYSSQALINSFSGQSGSDSTFARASSRGSMEIDDWDFIEVFTGPHFVGEKSEGLNGVAEVRGRASLSGSGWADVYASHINGFEGGPQ